MWDWDAEQVAKKEPVRPARTWAAGGIGILIAALFLGWLTIGLLVGRDVTRATGGSPAAGDRPLDDEQVREAAGILSGAGLRARNPNALGLSSAETLEVVDADGEMRLTPGTVGTRNDACSQAPLVTVALTVSATQGSMTWDPAAFQLVGPDGHGEPVLAGCSGAPVTLAEGQRLTVELPFAAAAPAWLVYAPDGPALGRWRLS
ncbi:hypothetical protein [Actinoplanes sp. NPDC049118]|uniref:hypothetical protein n=1 Tax=Actinoplanes sp. NPDC049118 TaxID=3155769 RepID=UPI0033BFCFF8